MVYKRESQVPTQLQRKLNSLAGLFETVDDQFERIRVERESYLAEVRESAGRTSTFLENELNLDSFKEYLKWRFPVRAVESWDGQARMVLDGLLSAGYKTLGDAERVLKQTSGQREAMGKALGNWIKLAADGTVPSNLEPALALVVSAPEWEKLIPWGPLEDIIREHRVDKKSSE